MLGGRAAEEIVFGRITSAAENDLDKATSMARRMVIRWGMSDRLGPVTLGETQDIVFLGRELGEQRPYSEKTASLIDDEVRRIVEEAHATAVRVLTEHQQELDRLAAGALPDPRPRVGFLGVCLCHEGGLTPWLHATPHRLDPAGCRPSFEA